MLFINYFSCNFKHFYNLSSELSPVCFHEVFVMVAAPPRFQCSYGMWECPGNYRICINQTLVCDGVSHCPNGNDEGPFCSECQ